MDLCDAAGEPIRYDRDGNSSCGGRCFGGPRPAVQQLVDREWASVFHRQNDAPEPYSLCWPKRGCTIDDPGLLSRAQGCLLGQIAGDSLGGLVEFQTSAILRSYPAGVRLLEDGGHWNTLAGQPTDDSEMALALARSIVNDNRYDPAAAARSYAWWYGSRPFDIGGTTCAAVSAAAAMAAGRSAAEASRRAALEDSQANGALMRISPLGILGAGAAESAAGAWAQLDASLTHPDPVCQQANRVFAETLAYAIRTGGAQELAYRFAVEAAARAGSGTVMDAVANAASKPPDNYSRQMGWALIALQNAYWQLLHATSLEEGMVSTVMSGGDTDTNAAITGALLGAVYARGGVPLQWLDRILTCRPVSGLAGVRHPRPTRSGLSMPSRAAARSREIAVRLALVASRVRLMRMLVTESVLLAMLAGLGSACLMWKAPEPLCRYLTMGVVTYPLPPDWRVFSYIGIVAVLAGVVSGLAPAIETLRADLNSPLKGCGGLGRAGGTKRALGWLVSAQVAMSMMLLVGAGLLSQAENRNLRGSPGYDPQKIVIAPLNFGEGGSIASAQVRLEAIKNRMLALPGVRSVAFSDRIPLFNPDTIELRPPGRPDAVQPVDIYTASPDFFRTLGIPILMGREFRSQDANAAIVSEALARLFWRRSSPVGQTVEFPDGSRLLVVGVAKNTEPQRFGGSDNPALYRLRQVSATFNLLAVRFDYGADKGARAVRAALRQVEPNMQLREVQLMQTFIDTVSQELWNFVSLILVLGLIATVLSASGIYGAVSFLVGRSMKDLGIRVALGATRAGIVWQVLITGGKPVLGGLIVGLWLSVAMAAVLRKALAGAPLRIDSSDPLLYFAALLVLIAAALLAMGAPARRGAASDPVEALRCE